MDFRQTQLLCLESYSLHVMPLEAGSSASTLTPSVTSRIRMLPSVIQAANMDA